MQKILPKILRYKRKYSKQRKNINKETYATSSEIGHSALVQSKVFEQATFIMGETVEDMGIEIELKDNNVELKVIIGEYYILELLRR